MKYIKKKYKGIIELIFMIFLSFITQVISLLRYFFASKIFGVSYEMDSFNLATSITTFIFSFIIAGVSTVVIPCYVKKINKKNIDSFITIIFMLVFFIVVVILFFRFSIISLISRKNIDFIMISGNILVVSIISNLFSVVTSITSAYFQYIEKYNTPKLITVFSQVIILVFLFYLTDITIFEYALILGLGSIINSIIDIFFAIKAGWRYKITFSINDIKTREMFDIFVPILLSTGIYQLSLIIDTSIAARLNTGDVTILNYSNQISSMINTLFITNLLMYFYPKMVKNIREKDGQVYFWERTYFFHAVICLLISGYVIIGKQCIAILFEHGRFTKENTESVFIISLIYIVALQINIIRDLIYRYFYAVGDTKSTTFNSVFTTIVNVIISILLVNFFGLFGVVLGTAISSCISLISIMIKFKIKFGYNESIFTIVLQYLKTILIMIATIILTYISKNNLYIVNKLFLVLILGIEVIIIYVILTRVFNKKIIEIGKKI